jgi:murein DD-endopeptidase MepM/ murein hydrolase activator NlpD
VSRRLGALLFAIVVLVVLPAATAGAFAGGPWSPPVDGRVVRGFDPPATRFGPGHLGVDYGVAPGTAVRAAGEGTVVFAGRVGSGLHVVVLHAADVRTTDSFLATVTVVRGQHVDRGAVLGTSGGTGPGHPADVLHFGVRVGDEYVDPMLLFAAPDLGALVHLAEPHGGAFGGSEPPVPAGAGTAGTAGTAEAASIAATLRVDARPPLRPPPWWSTATARSPGANALAHGPAVPPPQTAGPTRPASRDHDPDRASIPMIAAGGAAPAGAVLFLRRRRRVAMGERTRRRSREGGAR